VVKIEKASTHWEMNPGHQAWAASAVQDWCPGMAAGLSIFSSSLVYTV